MNTRQYKAGCGSSSVCFRHGVFATSQVVKGVVNTMAVIFSSLLADIAVGVATCIVALYLYFANAFRYWKRRGVHYEEPTFITGNMARVIFQRENFGEYLKKVYDNNPTQPVVGFFAANNPLLLVRDLDVLRNIMVKDAHAFLDRTLDFPDDDDDLFSKSLFFLEGKKWRHMRIKLTPTFTSGKLKKMFYLMNECGKQLVPCIDKEMSAGKCVAKDTVSRYSTDVIASCAFGVNANALADPNSEFRATMKKVLEITTYEVIITTLMFLAPWLVKLLKLKLSNKSVTNYVRGTFWDVVDYRKKNKVVRNDFVDILMQIKEKGQVSVEDDNDLDEIQQDSKYITMEHSRGDNVDINLQDDDFVAQAFIFIVAGFETASSVISFALYELAMNPAIQDKLREEILTVLDKHNSEVTYSAIAEMSYLEMVVSETLRKHPTVPILERKCLSDYEIPGTDITIDKETSVMIPVFGIHMDPAIYPDPEKFDPERFSPENKSKRSNFAFLPFGEGPRICIGMRFGLIQVKTALVHILTSFKVNTCADTPQPPLKMNPTAGLNIPKKDIVLAFQKLK